MISSADPGMYTWLSQRAGKLEGGDCPAEVSCLRRSVVSGSLTPLAALFMMTMSIK